MKKMKSIFLTAILSAVLSIALLPLSVLAAADSVDAAADSIDADADSDTQAVLAAADSDDTDTMGMTTRVEIDQDVIRVGDTVTANICMDENSGFTSLVFDVNYDDTIFSYVNGSTVYTDVLPAGMEAPSYLSRVGWATPWTTVHNTGTGVVATMQFTAIAAGTAVFYTSAQSGNVITTDYKHIPFHTVITRVQVLPALVLGDVNEDGAIDLKDVSRLFQYVSHQIEAIDSEAMVDVNADDEIDLKDVTKLFQYVNKQISEL